MRVDRENKVFSSDIETKYGLQGTFSPDEQVINISKICKGCLLFLPAAMDKHPCVKEQWACVVHLSIDFVLSLQFSHDQQTWDLMLITGKPARQGNWE